MSGVSALSDNTRARRILVGLLVGVVAGVATLLVAPLNPEILPAARLLAVNILDPFGQTFLRLLFFVIVPLILGSLVSGVLQLGDIKELGPLSARTFSYFFLNMAVATALGLVMMNLLAPGSLIDAPAREQLRADFGGEGRGTPASRPQLSLSTIVDMIMPRNLLGAVAGHQRDVIGEMLPLILFAILLGAAAQGMMPQRRDAMRSGFDAMTELMTTIVRMALRLAPYAVPALIYSVVVKVGFDILLALGIFVAGCLVVMLIHLFGVMALWIRFGTHFRPVAFFRAISAALITAFSTSSSMATLPTALEVARERLGLSPATAGFVLPLGTTMNMSGTALYEGCVVLLVAQIFGVDLSISEQVTLMLLAVLSAIAVAGIPGGALPLIAGLLATFGFPPEAIGIVLGIEGLLGAFRTLVNVGCDIVTAAVVDASFARIGSS